LQSGLPEIEVIDLYEEPEIVEKEYKKPQTVRKPQTVSKPNKDKAVVEQPSQNLDDLDTRCRAISPCNPNECDRGNL
jgi:hypothetical protein